MDGTKGWYRMIEDVIQCPVCMEVNNVSYIHCERGHHTCGYCIKSLTKCPMCYNDILPKLIRHLVAEDLKSRLYQIQLSIDEDIKSSITKSQQDQSVQTDILIANSSVDTQTDETNLSITNSSVRAQTDKTNLSITNSSVSTQTDKTNVSITNSSVSTQRGERYLSWTRANNRSLNKQFINEAYSYPCLICWCNFNKFPELEEHLEQNHKQNLQKGYLLVKAFDVRCDTLPWECDYVFSKQQVLYFINIIVRSNGCFKCSVRYIRGRNTSPSLYYRIIVLDEEKLKVNYEGKIKPHTAECKVEDVYDVCFSAKRMSIIMKQTESFNFTVSISEFS